MNYGSHMQIIGESVCWPPKYAKYFAFSSEQDGLSAWLLFFFKT